MTVRKYDVVLFGATGFTGKLTAEYLRDVRTEAPLRWALAGRNLAKLEAVKAQLGERAQHVELVQADLSDPASLARMARSTKVVITTVGPYLHYGEPLVRACIEEQAHYVDLTGEPLFVDAIISRYHERAKAQHVKIVHACGFDSIPHDLGVFFAIRELENAAGSLEDQKVSIQGFVQGRGDFSGGTWHSALGMLGQLSKVPKYSALKPKTDEDGRHVEVVPLRMHNARKLGKWALPLPTIDPDIVCRSARFDRRYGKDFRYGHYVALPNLFVALAAAAGIGLLLSLAQFKLTRDLLLKLKAQGEGPDAETRAKSWFTVTFLAETEGHAVRCLVRGGDPGYGETSKMLAEAALSLAHDQELPGNFGVVTPVSAMGEALLVRMIRAGMEFQKLPA